MKVADYIINTLAEEGIKDVFVVYGAANGDLIDAFTRNEKIRYVAMMHEQAGGFAAEAYARVTGNYGAAIATSGPGGMNFVTPIGNCFYESVPVIFITGQPNSKFLRKSKEVRQNAFQETDIVDIVAPITKYAVKVMDPKDVPLELGKCLHIMKEGRPGPVLLDIPLDVQKAELPARYLMYVATPFHPPVGKLDGFIEKFLVDLSSAKKPVIIVGGGAKKDAVAVRKLIETLNIPAFPTWNALDVITDDFPLYGGRIGTYGGPGRNFAIQNADLLLAIGTRLSGRIYGGVPASFMRNAKKYLVDIDEAILKPGNHDLKFDHVLHSDVESFVDTMNNWTLETYAFQGLDWIEQVMSWKEKYGVIKKEYQEKEPFVNPYWFMQKLSRLADKEDIIVADCGGNIVITNQAFETKFGQMMFSNNGNSPMGFSFAAAIGAWFGKEAAQRKGRVICIIGDGGMNMNIQELQIIHNYGVKIVVILLNNHIYGITKAFQETNFQGRAEACGPKGYNPPNFVRICSAYGITAFEVVGNDSASIDNSIQKAFSYVDDSGIDNFDNSIVVDVNCHDWHSYEPRIFGWNTPIEDMYPYIPRNEFVENMQVPMADGYDWKNPPVPDVVKQTKTME